MLRDYLLTPPQLKALAKDNWKLRKVNLGAAIASLLFVGISAACSNAGAETWDPSDETTFVEAMRDEGFSYAEAECALSFISERYTPEQIGNDEVSLGDGLDVIDECELGGE